MPVSHPAAMRHIIKALAIIAALIAGPAPVIAQNLPPGTVQGRLPPIAGPAEDIPFATLTSQLQLFTNIVVGPATTTVGDFAFWGAANGQTLLDGGVPGALAFLGAGTGLASSGGDLNLKPAAASTIGGIESLTCAAHQWLNTISTLGVPTCAQPAIADVSGWGTNVATALGNALNASGGVLGVNALGTNVQTALGNPAGGTGGFALNSQLAAYLLLAGGTVTGTANFTGLFQINGNAMTFPATAATLLSQGGAFVNGHCLQASGTAGAVVDAGAACGTGGGGINTGMIGGSGAASAGAI